MRIELGPRDLEAGQATASRRDTLEKQTIALDGLTARLKGLLDEIQAGMVAAADAFVAAKTTEVGDYEQFKQVLEEKKGFIAAGWDGSAESEAAIKEETKATIRCIPLEGSEPAAGLTDIFSGQPAKHRVLFARAY